MSPIDIAILLGASIDALTALTKIYQQENDITDEQLDQAKARRHQAVADWHTTPGDNHDGT